MLRYKTETRPGLVALYVIQPGNRVGQFLQPRSTHGAHHQWHLRHQQVALTVRRNQLPDGTDGYLYHSAGNLLSQLHWLPVQSRISFKRACLIHKTFPLVSLTTYDSLSITKHTSPYFMLNKAVDSFKWLPLHSKPSNFVLKLPIILNNITGNNENCPSSSPFNQQEQCDKMLLAINTNTILFTTQTESFKLIKK